MRASPAEQALTMKDLLRACFYACVLGGSTIAILGSLSFFIDQTIQHVAEIRGSPEPTRLRPSYVAPTPALTTKDVAAIQSVPVTGEGEAAKVQMGLSAIDTVTTGSISPPAAEPNPNLFRVSSDGLNMRSAGSKGSPKIGVLKLGEEVEIAETNGNWVRVVRADGEGGWVFSKYLVPVE
jgi:uncharacterized protein YgiM (DUF1202 family)